MAIVATKDTRNSAWAADTTNFGHKMLAKMGWKGGESGLGKHQQGAATNLRAVRRADALGIGAESDAFGDKGWRDTNAGFHGVLASLQREYGSEREPGAGAAPRRSRKEAKKRKRRDAQRGTHGDDSGSEGQAKSHEVRLPQNKVQAGHARKMREAKDIRSKSAADMAAVFGVKADFYQQPRDWGVAPSGSPDVDTDDSSAGEKKKRKKSKKKARAAKDKREAADDGKSKKDKKKRKRSGEDSDVEDRKKSKKDKSKK